MSNPYQSPPSLPGASWPQHPGEGDSTGGVIPYKNPYALFAYYSGIFGLICCVTPVPLGIVPVICGIIGLQRRARNPVIKGSVHAWIGIVLGALSALGSVLMAIGLIAALMDHRKHSRSWSSV